MNFEASNGCGYKEGGFSPHPIQFIQYYSDLFCRLCQFWKHKTLYSGSFDKKKSILENNRRKSKIPIVFSSQSKFSENSFIMLQFRKKNLHPLSTTIPSTSTVSFQISTMILKQANCTNFS